MNWAQKKLKRYLAGKKKSPEKIDNSEKEVIEPKEILDKAIEYPRVTWKDFLMLGILIVVIGVVAGLLIFSVVNPVFPVGEIFATVCT